MSNKEIALKLTEKIIDNRGDKYYYTETGVINLYKRVLKEIKKLEKQEYYIPKQKVIARINYYDERIKHAKQIRDKEQEEFYIDLKRNFNKLLEEK